MSKVHSFLPAFQPKRKPFAHRKRCQSVCHEGFTIVQSSALYCGSYEDDGAGMT